MPSDLLAKPDASDADDAEAEPKPAVERRKVRTNAIRLNNNLLDSAAGIFSVFSEIIVDPLQVQWLDLSSNKLRDIPDELLLFSNLSRLHLHGNQITSFKQIQKLQVRTSACWCGLK